MLCPDLLRSHLHPQVQRRSIFLLLRGHQHVLYQSLRCLRKKLQLLQERIILFS